MESNQSFGRGTAAAHLPHRFRDLLSRWLFIALIACSAAGCASLPSNANRQPSTAIEDPDSTALGQLTQQLHTASRARSASGLRLLDSVEAALGGRLALIDAAQRTLDLQYYAIQADVVTEQLLERLRAAAERGVRVRILLDDLNTVGPDAQVLRIAFEKNVEVRLFNPLVGPRDSQLGRVVLSMTTPQSTGKRMHNKLFIADNAWGIAGGRNLGDAYFGGNATGYFVDLDVLVAGPVVREMSVSFDHYWNDALAYPVQLLMSPDDIEMLRAKGKARQTDPAKAAQAPPPVAAASVLPDITSTGVQHPQPTDLSSGTMTWAPAAVLFDKPGKVGPGDDEVNAGDTLIDGLLQLMSLAKEHVLVVTPYFVPGAAAMKQFSDLRARGIRVRVLTNSLASNDTPAAHAGYARYRKDLLTMGVELYELRAAQEDPAEGPEWSRDTGSGGSMGSGGSLGSGAGRSAAGSSRATLHSKFVIIDNRLSVIGSMNLDLRSQRKNSEVALVIRSGSLARQAAGLVEGTLGKGAYRLELADSKLVWHAPPGAPFKDTTDEPEASARLKLLVNVVGPFAPEEML